MLAVLQELKSVAASGTDVITVAVPNGTRALGLTIAARYAAVAGTSGIQASFQVSPDGTTFSASKHANVTVVPAANVVGSSEALFTFQDDPYKVDANPVEAIKITLTNLDATNAAAVAVLSENKNALGR